MLGYPIYICRGYCDPFAEAKTNVDKCTLQFEPDYDDFIDGINRVGTEPVWSEKNSLLFKTVFFAIDSLYAN